MIKCRSGKKVYVTELLAEDALLDAHIRNNYAGTGPINIYKCEECGYFHFTSKGKMSEKLAALFASGKLKLQQEASHWEKKLKR